MIKTLKSLWKSTFEILSNAIKGFAADRVPKLSAALAYTTLFSLAPMLLLIIIVGGSIYSEAAISGKLFSELKDIIGDNAAAQIQDIIKRISVQQNSKIATIISSVVLMVGATGIFVEIQDSLNLIWGVRPKAKKGFIKLLINRLVSFSMIIGLGFLLIVSLLANTLLLALSQVIPDHLPALPINMLSLTNTAFIFVVISFLFAVIFKMLPDVKLKWKQIWPGAFLTGALFMLGKYIIGIYIGNNRTVSFFGAAGSIIILLLWIYFSAFILYFGAEFTRAYLEFKKVKVEPNNYAEFTEKVIAKNNSAEIQQ